MSGGHSLRIDRLIQDYQATVLPIGLHRVDARVKLGLLVAAVAINVGFARPVVSGPLLLVALAGVLRSRIPLRLFALFFFAPLWATVLIMAGFSLGFGHTPLAQWGALTLYQEGVWLGIGAGLRVLSDMAWMAAVFLTTPFDKLLMALRWYRLPEAFVDAFDMTYRYAFLLADECFRMMTASSVRGGTRGFRRRLKGLGMILAQVILRAYDRAARIQQAMVARGAEAKSK
ncbi:MAG: cobalt ECF transporter T component CbiQ [Pseudomonadales bacterium]|jgi:cobalt/nickel transport system permease protein|nr:cobalt ECF transporter T component CbiQ [Pseudomonadales bacterium]